MARSTIIRFKEARRIKYHYLKYRPRSGETYTICGIKVSINNVVAPQENPADDVCKQCIRAFNKIQMGDDLVSDQKQKILKAYTPIRRYL